MRASTFAVRLALALRSASVALLALMPCCASRPPAQARRTRVESPYLVAARNAGVPPDLLIAIAAPKADIIRGRSTSKAARSSAIRAKRRPTSSQLLRPTTWTSA